MAYRISGSYVAVCSCSGICPCPVDGKPSHPEGHCWGTIVFDVREGNLDDTELSGTTFSLWNYFPSNITAGDWKVGIVVDDGASDDQAQAIERIVSGQEGGPFGDFVPLIGEYLGMERGRVTYGNGDSPSGSVGGDTEFSFEPFRGSDGSATSVRGAMFGFAPEYRIGQGSGRASSSGFGISFDPTYGENAEFEFSSEAAGELHPRA